MAVRERISLISSMLVLCLHTQLQAGTTEAQRAVLDDIARGGSGSSWTPLSPQQLVELGAKAEAHLDNYLAHHAPDGLNADIQWTSFNRTSVFRYDGLGDSTTWTGHYLAAQALQYSVTGNVALLAEIDAAVDKLDIASQVASPGVLSLARHTIPNATLMAPNSPYHHYYSHYGGTTADPDLGQDAFDGVGAYSDYVYLGGTWKDTYDGVNLGLATTYKYVDDPAIRAKVTTIVERLTDQHVTGLTKLLWRFHCAAMLRTAATVNPGKYQSEYESVAAGVGTGSTIETGDQVYDHYFTNNLDFIDVYVLTQLETDPALKAKWESKLANMWGDVRDHLNAHFAAIYMAGTGDTSDAGAVAALQGQLADFPDAPRYNARTINSTRTDLEFVTVDGQLYAKHAPPIEEIPPSDFIWQRHPFKLDGGHDDPEEYPGIDMFLPYWMGRQIGVLIVPVQGDANGDGVVDDDDLSLLLANWTGAGGEGKTWGQGDFDGNGGVSNVDLSIVLANWTGSTAVPEPTAGVLMALGAFGLLRRNRDRCIDPASGRRRAPKARSLP